jgi:hypothetical protein
MPGPRAIQYPAKPLAFRAFMLVTPAAGTPPGSHHHTKTWS